MKGRAATFGFMLSGLVVASLVGSVRPIVAQNWHDLGPKERYDAMQNYWRHQRLPEDRQRAVEEHYERWRTLPPDQRDRVRQNYERFRQLPPQERERFEKKYQKWKEQAPPQPPR